MLRRAALRAGASSGLCGSTSTRTRGFASSGASQLGWFGLGGASADDASSAAVAQTAADAARVGETATGELSTTASTSAFSFDAIPDVVGHAASALAHAHDLSGLPWWITIGASAVAVRLALLPAAVRQAKAGALVTAAVARAKGPDGKPPRSMRDIYNAASELRRRTNGVAVGWLIAGPLVQLPVFFVAVLGVRRLAQQPDIGLELGGAAWFTDLTLAAVDVSTATAPMGLMGAALPCATAAALFANVHRSLGPAAAAAPAAATLKLFVEWLTVPTLMIGMQLPHAIHMYWLPASLSALAQGAFMRTPEGRRALGIDPDFAAAARYTAKEQAAAGLNLSRALDADEVRWLRDAAQARADKKNEDALRMLERAAARMPAPEAEEEPPRADAAGDGDTLDAAAGETKTSRGKAAALTASASAHPTVLYALAQTRMVLKLWKDAANAYELSAKMEVNAERRAMAFAGAGVARANVGDLAAAATALGAAIALNDKDVSSMISLAAVRKRSGDLKGAFEVLERAAKIAPEVRERFIAPLEKETARGGKKGGNARASSGGHKVKGAGREQNAHEGGRNGGRGDNDRRT